MMIVDLDARDIDEGVNSELVYFFVGGSQDSGPFHIDRDNGTLYLVGKLDYEMTTIYYVSVHGAISTGRILANIFLNHKCLKSSPGSS